MTPEERQRLRDWSARDLMRYVEAPYVYSPPNSFYTKEVRAYLTKDGAFVCYKKDWTPDLPASPASQILGVIEKMAELGFYRFDVGSIINYEEDPPKVERYNASFASLKSTWIGCEADNPLDAILLAARKAVEGR